MYEIAQTPYQRLLRSGVLSEAKKAELATTYGGLNPVRLLNQINGNLEQLWKNRTTRPGNRIYDATKKASVTV